MDSPEQLKLFAALFETHGVAEIAHDWPAQQLLDYGNSVLGALRPGMIYLGGTDAGRFIPTLLNDTEDPASTWSSPKTLWLTAPISNTQPFYMAIR